MQIYIGQHVKVELKMRFSPDMFFDHQDAPGITAGKYRNKFFSLSCIIKKKKIVGFDFRQFLGPRKDFAITIENIDLSKNCVIFVVRAAFEKLKKIETTSIFLSSTTK